jgi:uncharacterized protein YndB with AHSA1/START domain
VTDVLEQVEGRSVVRLERRFAHPVERVWAAITDPAQLVEWFCGMEEVLALEPVEGGRYVVRWLPELADEIVARSSGDPLVTEDTVLRAEPPHVLEHTLDGRPANVVRWELHPDGDGCRLRLTHVVDPEKEEIAQLFLEGWGMCLGFMLRALDGDPVGLPGMTLEEITTRYGSASA